MAIEKSWAAVPAQVITSSGTSLGHIGITDARKLHVKQIVTLFSDVVSPIEFQVKRINSVTDIELGPDNRNINDRSDLSMFLTSDNAKISAKLQLRTQGIPPQEINRAVYEEEPAVAIRSMLVDRLGDYVTTDNPLPVQLSDGSINIETLNAELRVQLSAKDNDPTAGDVHSSVRIGDQNGEATVTAGALNVNVVNSGGGALPTVNSYNQVSAVPQNVPTTVVSYLVPALKTAVLEKVFVAGNNIAQFEVYKNLTKVETRFTWYGHFNESFDFASNGTGFGLVAGDMVIVKVTNLSAQGAGDFNARIQAIESV